MHSGPFPWPQALHPLRVASLLGHFSSESVAILTVSEHHSWRQGGDLRPCVHRAEGISWSSVSSVMWGYKQAGEIASLFKPIYK